MSQLFQISKDCSKITGPWTKEEDEHVIELVRKYGPKRWTLIAKHLKGRIGKQCRERWHNHLNPEIKKTSWTEEEDRIIYSAHKQWGNQVFVTKVYNKLYQALSTIATIFLTTIVHELYFTIKILPTQIYMHIIKKATLNMC